MGFLFRLLEKIYNFIKKDILKKTGDGDYENSLLSTIR